MHTRIATCLLVVSALAGCAGIPELAFEPDASVDGSRSAADAADANLASDGGADGGSLLDAGSSADAASDDAANDAEWFDADVLDGTAAHDASDHDASDRDADDGDGGGNTCPAGPPPGASVCCKGVPCHGAAPSCHSECTNCANNCGGQTCCLDQNGNYHGCAKSPADCPP